MAATGGQTEGANVEHRRARLRDCGRDGPYRQLAAARPLPSACSRKLTPPPKGEVMGRPTALRPAKSAGPAMGWTPAHAARTRFIPQP